MKAPLKTILRNFLNHVEDLEARKELGDDQYETEFQELKQLTDKLKGDPAYPYSFGSKDVNRPKNRYKDIVPYDFSRVILPKYEGVPGSDYINASYIKGASGAFAYIAAQGPLPNTVMDFWRMIWVCDVQVVVMACNEKEAGKFKCEAYWPSSGEIKHFGNISVELIKTSQVCSDYLVRTFLVECDSEMRDVFQFHYTTWPDHGVPDTVQPILDLVHIMRDYQASETVPIVVHCSAGCGRTGTICAVDYVWACLRHGKLDEDFSLYQIALELRRQRIAMIQTKEQYILAHKAVASMFSQQLKVIDCHIYENIDEDGEPLMWKEVEKDDEFICSKTTLNTKEDAKSVIFKAELHDESSSNSNFYMSTKYEKTQVSSVDSLSHNSSEINIKSNDCALNSSHNSESSFSRNSILSQQSNEDSIPFIDEDEVCIRPNCGRAYLDIPSCVSISKLMNRFDPFVDRVSLGTDDSSPEGDPFVIDNKIKDFQLASSSKTLENNTKMFIFTEDKNSEKFLDSKSDIVDCSVKIKSQSLFYNRESYPPCSNSENYQKNLSNVLENEIDESNEDIKSTKKVGKATVVRRPSISKLKALFEKSGVSSQRNSSDGSKRLLFRNNSQQVSRAGSAPPSLNCMDKNSAAEKESILMMVTRKFRSSSVRTEREMQTKQKEVSLNRKSATEAVKDSFNALTRSMSFTINKTFKSYSPSKTKLDTNKKGSTNNPNDNITGTYKQKSSDLQKGNSMWYDRPCLPRAVAIVKPTGNFETNANSVSSRNPPPPKTPEKNKSSEQNFNYISKPSKFKGFFSSLNKKDTKDSLSLWYKEFNPVSPEETVKNNPESNISSNCIYSSTKSFTKTSPFLPISSWKKVGSKSPLSSPDSPKTFTEVSIQPNSKFYTDILGAELPVADSVPAVKQSDADVHKCPIPEEIIPLNLSASNFWPSSSLSNSISEIKPDGKNNTSISIGTISEQTVASESVKNKIDDKLKDVNDVPPAIPKKMIIGKNKNLQGYMLDKSSEVETLAQTVINDLEIKKPFEEVSSNVPEEKGDHYINVNIKAIKNLEQIENTLRKNPRGAIIDLTSRESYSMEDELVNAVNQLSDSSEESKLSSEYTGNKQVLFKTNSKFPGYEVIWPEIPNISIQKSKLSCKAANKLSKKGLDNLLSGQTETGICYSPPLRRKANSSLSLAKSQSCGSLDWLENEDACSAQKELSSTVTKWLVNEAVGELNTLLNQLTTRTLSEDVNFDSKSKEKSEVTKPPSDEKTEEKSVTDDHGQNDTIVHSVTLVTKSYNSGSSPMEEEIVFHFPPPPRVPPPPNDDIPDGSFNVICKDGSLVVKEADHQKEDSKSTNQKILSQFPQPAPRKSKNTDGLKRSSSYSNIGHSLQSKNKGYENIFLEKYQTISRLQIKPDGDQQNILDKSVPLQKSSILYNSSSSKQPPNYVNVADVYKVSKSDNLNSGMVNTETNESNKRSGVIAKNIGQLSSNTKLTNSQGSSKIIIDKTDDSVYGKIYKVSSNQIQSNENSSEKNMISISTEAKKKLVPSKKTERAPLPPNTKQVEVSNNEMALKASPNMVIQKKLPSRKLEKAPPPPHILQKSSSAMIHPKKILQGSKCINFSSSHGVEEKNKLPAVHENVPNAASSSFISNKPINSSLPQNKFVNRGLSHSQSDVSVFLALKERRIQATNQDYKILNLKSLMNKNGKQTTESLNVSSSDSDSSYERIFLTKNESVNMPKIISVEQKESNLPRNHKKETPVAPPRSKRRSTTEVHYSRVKTKDASLKSTSRVTHGVNEIKNSTLFSNTKDEPPAIPVKTKDAFEIPGENLLSNMNKRENIQRRPVSNFSSVK